MVMAISGNFPRFEDIWTPLEPSRKYLEAMKELEESATWAQNLIKEMDATAF
jgi:hypothetical protein